MNISKAKPPLKTALEIDPNSALANAYLAEILTLRVAEGKGWSERSMKLQKHPGAHKCLIPTAWKPTARVDLVLEQTGNFEEAIAEYQAAIQINGKFADLHLALGRTLSGHGGLQQCH